MAGRAPARFTGALFCLGGAAHALRQSADERAALAWALAPAWVLSVSGAGLFWAFVATLFRDRAGAPGARFAPVAALLATALAAEVSPAPLDRGLWLAQNLAGAALFTHALALIWTGWRGDLVEARRRLRGPVLAGAGLYGLGVVVSQALEALSRPDRKSVV